MDLVKRQFKADRPNALWVSDFTYVPTWQGFSQSRLYSPFGLRVGADGALEEHARNSLSCFIMKHQDKS